MRRITTVTFVAYPVILTMSVENARRVRDFIADEDGGIGHLNVPVLGGMLALQSFAGGKKIAEYVLPNKYGEDVVVSIDKDSLIAGLDGVFRGRKR